MVVGGGFGGVDHTLKAGNALVTETQIKLYYTKSGYSKTFTQKILD